MEYLIKDITSVTSLKKMAKEVGYDLFIEFSELVLGVSHEVKTQKKEEERELEERKEKLSEYFKLMVDDGLTTLSEAEFIMLHLNSATQKPPQIDKRKKVEPKYIYTDENGKDKTWSGRGPRPERLKELAGVDGSLDAYLINNKKS